MYTEAAGRRGLGFVLGFDAKLTTRGDGRLKVYRVRLVLEVARRLAEMLENDTKDAPGRILAASSPPDLNRVRVMSDPMPAYESSASPAYVRGDVLRVTGTQKSCNVFVSRIGAELIVARIRAALPQCSKWIEFRARIVRFQEDEGPRSLIEIVPDSQLASRQEDGKLGETGAVLAEQVWATEDFRDWEPQDA